MARCGAIRAYIAHLTGAMAASSAPTGGELRAWLIWAEGVADRLDPRLGAGFQACQRHVVAALRQGAAASAPVSALAYGPPGHTPLGRSQCRAG